MEIALATDLFNSASVDMRARLLSLRLPHAGRWIRSFPASHESTMPDTHYRLATCARLGLLPHPLLQGPCAACRTQEMSLSPAHFLGCPQMARTSLTARHDSAVRRLHSFFTSLDIPSYVEPRMDDQDGKHPDLEVHLETGVVLIDVSVVCPCAPSYVDSAARDASACLRAREQAKIAKYRQQVAEARALFVPFVVSAFGGFGAAACDFLSLLRVAAAARMDALWARNPVDELVRDLSMGLQRGNAIAQIEGCRRCGQAVLGSRSLVLAPPAPPQPAVALPVVPAAPPAVPAVPMLPAVAPMEAEAERDLEGVPALPAVARPGARRRPLGARRPRRAVRGRLEPRPGRV